MVHIHPINQKSIYPVFISGGYNEPAFVGIDKNLLSIVSYQSIDIFNRPIHFTGFIKNGEHKDYLVLCTPPYSTKLSKVNKFNLDSLLLEIDTPEMNLITEVPVGHMGWNHDEVTDYRIGNLKIKRAPLTLLSDKLKEFKLEFSLEMDYTFSNINNSLLIKDHPVVLHDITQGIEIKILGYKFDVEVE